MRTLALDQDLHRLEASLGLMQSTICDLKTMLAEDPQHRALQDTAKRADVLAEAVTGVLEVGAFPALGSRDRHLDLATRSKHCAGLADDLRGDLALKARELGVHRRCEADGIPRAIRTLLRHTDILTRVAEDIALSGRAPRPAPFTRPRAHP